MTILFRTAILLAAGIAVAALAGCGGSGSSDLSAGPVITQFTSDQRSYFVGDQAQLTAVYTNGVGHIEPGNIAISSGQTLKTPPLTAAVTYRLTVEGNGATATSDLPLAVSYRDRIRTVSVPFARAGHVAVTLNDGRVLIVGGEDETTAFPTSLYVFDPSSETFTQFGSLTLGRVSFVAVTLANGDVLVSGGIPAIPDAVLINGRTGTVTATRGEPLHPRFYATGTLLPDGTVLIVGGASGNTATSSAEVYDPTSGTFTELRNGLSVARLNHVAVATKDGRVLIYGGATADGSPAPPELYNPATHTFTVLPAAENTVRVHHTAVRGSDGNLWVVGGDDDAVTMLSSVIEFNATTQVLSHALDLATPRADLAAAPLADSRLLIAGGTTDIIMRQVTETSELISTATAQRTDGPSMGARRMFHTMTPMANGKILIVGGLDENRRVLASAEIFE